MSNLKNVSIYNLNNEVVCSKCSGIFDQKRSDDAFDTSLRLSTGDLSRLAIGESYYAIGLTDENAPVRSEVVKCMTAGDTSTLEGSIKFPEKPEGFKAEGSDADMLIEFTNYTNTQFDLDTYVAHLEYGFGSLTTFPGPTLQAGAGQQSISASQILGWLAEGPADIACTWYDPNSGAVFGAWVHFNLQVFRIGPEPIWMVTSDGSNWTPSGSDPSMPYTWPASIGHNITATPSVSHSSLSVSVIIQ